MHNERPAFGLLESKLKKIEKLHPHLLMTYLLIIGVFILFAGLLFVYGLSLAHRMQVLEYRIPKALFISTLCIMASSFFVYRGRVAFVQDDIGKHARELGFAFSFGIIFCLLQLVGWKQLYTDGVMFTGTAIDSFLFLLPGLHALHLIGGMFFMAKMWWNALNCGADPVRSLILVTNPYEHIKWQMLQVYWHFMDALWLLIFLLFLFTVG
jgi:cytochrome c oxidase subunit III